MEPRSPEEKPAPGELVDLRLKAEEFLLEKAIQSPEDFADISPEKVALTLHELRVHQIELEMQNEELRRAQASLDTLKQRYFDLYDLAPVGYCTISSKGLILESNLTTATLLGCTRLALKKEPFLRFVLKEDHDTFYLLTRQLLQTSEPLICDLRMVKANGDIFWANLTATAALDLSKPTCRVVISDISVRKQTEELLKQAEEKFRLLVENSHDIIYTLSADGVFIFASAAWTILLGHPLAEVIGQPFQPFVHSDDLALCTQWLGKVIETGQRQEGIEYRVRHINGSWLWHTSSLVPLWNEAGKIVGVQGVARDITKRKQAEIALQESSVRFTLAINGTGAGLWDWDIVKDQVVYSPQWKKMLGYEPHEIEDTYLGWKNLWHPDDRKNTEKIIHAFLSGETKQYEVVHRLLHKNGDWRWILVRGEIIKDSQGNPVRWIGTNLDITGIKQAEAYRIMNKDILKLLNAPGDFHDSMQSVLAVLKECTGCDAAAIRMQVDNDYPYFVHDGFSEDFLLTENTIVQRVAGGGLCRDTYGNVCLECTCGLVVSGKTDPANPFFTNAGSCWSNNKADTPFNAARLHARDRCFHDGFLSVALVPVRTDKGIVGLIQLNARREGLLTLEIVEQIEETASNIASTLMRKQAEEDYQMLFSKMLDGFALHEIICDEAGKPSDYRFLAVNPSFEQITGLKASEIKGCTVSEVLPGIESSWIETYGKVALTGETAFFESYSANLNKHLSVTAFRPAPNKFACLFSDITERKQADQALSESEARFKSLHNASFGGIAIHVNGIILECNQGLADMTGYSVEEIIGVSVLTLVAENSRELVSRNISAGYEKLYEAICLRKNGSEFPIRVEARNIPYKGKTARTVEFRDITEQVRIMEEREKLQLQLNQAQKLESIGLLAGGVAHDFNNMLGVILGYAELALETVDPAQPIFASLQEIHKAAERSADLTRQLLAFARKQIIAPKILDLNKSVENIFKMLKLLVGEDIDLKWLPGQNLWPVKADPSQLDQILTNLTANARDAIRGVGQVSIETANSTFSKECSLNFTGFCPGDFVVLTFTDSGNGMDKETIDRLFEPFYTTKTVGKGIGLGLATVYGAVKQNNGFITVSSEPGHGTTFTICLPRYVGKISETSVEESARKPVLRGCETILLAEDEPAIRRMITEMLEGQGYTVLAAETPGEALRLATMAVGKVHLLLSDIIMPEMNGQDLANQLTGIFPHLKVLFMSGFTADAIAHHCVLDRDVHFLQKPFSIKDLIAMVKEELSSE
jgi:PAS domain S-box-containing protein